MRGTRRDGWEQKKKRPWASDCGQLWTVNPTEMALIALDCGVRQATAHSIQSGDSGHTPWAATSKGSGRRDRVGAGGRARRRAPDLLTFRGD